MTLRPGALVRVPFPYADRPVRQHRPALVVAAPTPAEGAAVLWVLMVTSAENRPWPGDVPVADHAAAGLPAPSVIRTAKIATIDARDASLLGTLPDAERAQVIGMLRGHLALDR